MNGTKPTKGHVDPERLNEYRVLRDAHHRLSDLVEAMSISHQVSMDIPRANEILRESAYLRGKIKKTMDDLRVNLWPDNNTRVTSRDQVEALPDGKILVDRRGTIWQKISGKWYSPGSSHSYSAQSVMLPADTVHSL